MSKILKAMSKQTGSHPDFKLKLETLADGDLYPLPAKQQLDEFSKLANHLVNMRASERGLVFVFSASTAGEGTSFVSYNIARHLTVMLDKRVAWVDANFLAPQPKLIGKKPDFRNMLRYPENVGELKFGGGISMIPNGDLAIKQTELLTGPNYTEMLDAMRGMFAFTIIDAPPVMDSVDVGHLAKKTDGLILVVESRRLKGEVIQHSIDTLRGQGVDVMGTVINKRVYDLPGFIYKRLSGV